MQKDLLICLAVIISAFASWFTLWYFFWRNWWEKRRAISYLILMVGIVFFTLIYTTEKDVPIIFQIVWAGAFGDITGLNIIEMFNTYVNRKNGK